MEFGAKPTVFPLGQNAYLRYNKAMNINIKTTELDLTPSLKVFINEKLGGLAKFVKGLDKEGAVEMHCEIARTTKHHRHGNVFKAEVNLHLPKKLLRAVEYHEDARKAIDALKKTLRAETSSRRR